MPYLDRRTGQYVDTLPAGGLNEVIASELPLSIASEVAAPAYSLPGSPEASTALRGLQRSGVSGLESLLGTSDTARRQAVEDALFGKQSETIDRTATDLRRDIEEGTFGRGVGLSTITADMMDRLNRETLDAKARARREAVLGSGAETRADKQAQLAAVGQAFSEGTTGLQGEANVGMANTAREQAARQFGAQQAFQNLLTRLGREQQGAEFSASLGQQASQSQAALQNARDISGNQNLTAGLAGGLGGLANVFAPQLRGLADKGIAALASFF